MDTSSVRVYSTEDTPRLRYIVSLILGDILGLTWEITTDKRKTRKPPIINYSGDDINGSFRIIPGTLLFEKGIKEKEIAVSEWNNLPVFFTTPEGSDFPFDIFAASFFLVSRYEEYLDHVPDEHGRYRASSSLAFRKNFLNIPLVDLWVMELAKVFIRKFRNIAVRRNEFNALLTIDADQPFAYHGRSILKSLSGLAEDLKNHSLSKRYKAITHAEKDPYDVFEYIFSSIKNNKAETRFFFPVGDQSKYDQNPSWKNTEYRKLITDFSLQFKAGLHPSYDSAFRKEKVHTEIARLKEITGNRISSSRFHYLRFRLPDSYRMMSETGITEDYSMGYPDESGFRAGIARPFYFYDILREQQTDLRIYPFQIMDATILGNGKMNPEEAMRLILKMIATVRKVGGTFISIWHNTSLLDDEPGQSGRRVFEFMLNCQNCE